MKITKKITYETSLPNGEVLTASTEEELEMLYKEKTVIEDQNVNVKFPFYHIGADYHEFRFIQEFLSDMTQKTISYKELDSDDGVYVAIFWVGEIEPVEETRKIIKEYTETS